MKTKFYEAPACEIVEVKIEGVICQSGTRSMGLDGSGGDKNVEGREEEGVWGDGGWK